jgi:hypothetical protein
MGIPPPERHSLEYLARLVTGEIEKWSGPIKAANIAMD